MYRRTRSGRASLFGRGFSPFLQRTIDFSKLFSQTDLEQAQQRAYFTVDRVRIHLRGLLSLVGNNASDLEDT